MSDQGELAARAGRLRALHHGPELLVLPNAWDAASARAVADAGFAAVATTSGGVAVSLGWEDREQTPPDEMFAAIARIARVVSLPVTADIESGYGLSAEELAARLLAAGAVGCNLEDSDHAHPGTLVTAEAHAARIAAVKQAARARGVDIVVNARVDVVLRQIGVPETRVAETIRRSRLYLQAGADCVFPIFMKDEAAIAAVVQGVEAAPVNILAIEGAPSLARLRGLGVARVSYGGGLQKMALADHQRRLAAIRAGESL
jgi:2-methylisocitrate lyase-like PEP mutase family enzyme